MDGFVNNERLNYTTLFALLFPLRQTSLDRRFTQILLTSLPLMENLCTIDRSQKVFVHYFNVHRS